MVLCHMHEVSMLMLSMHVPMGHMMMHGHIMPHGTLHAMLNMKQHEIHELYIKKTFEHDLCMLPLHVVIWCMIVCSGCMLAWSKEV